MWYAAYGSNLSWERFSVYIRGGRAGQRLYQGARDNSLPTGDRPIVLAHEMYFARRSTVWGGGVAFVRLEPDPSAKTLGRAYRIRADQFVDVFRQENRAAASDLPWERLLPTQAVFPVPVLPLGWYGTVLVLGRLDGEPLLTFTCASEGEPNRPTEPYLDTIRRGLAESHQLTALEIAAYLDELSCA